jgi:hypothetical protein
MLYLFGFVLILGYRPVASFPLTIHFSFFVGEQPLRLSTASYKNPFGEPFSVDQYKYYISQIDVSGPDGVEQKVLTSPHLVDAADTSTLTLHLTTGIAPVTSIRFDIGVDSSAVSSGVPTGDLDPMLGMFWTWNTGYIFARLEGRSDSAHTAGHRFTWDVGGYRPGVEASREIVLPLGAGPRTIGIRANLLRWFDGKHPTHLSQSPNCHQPGTLAMQLADNYSTMFSIVP